MLAGWAPGSVVNVLEYLPLVDREGNREETVTEPAGGRPLWRLARYERALWSLALLGLFADGVLTVYGLHAGLTEANPVVAGAAAVFGPALGVGLIKLGSLGVGLGSLRVVAPKHRALVPLALGSVWLLAATVNVVTIGVV